MRSKELNKKRAYEVAEIMATNTNMPHVVVFNGVSYSVHNQKGFKGNVDGIVGPSKPIEDIQTDEVKKVSKTKKKETDEIQDSQA